MELITMLTPKTNFSTSLLLPLTVQKLPISQSQVKHQPITPLPPLHQNTNIEETKQVHAHMIKTQFNHNHQFSLNFFQPHSSPAAQFNFIITSYIRNNQPNESINIYVQLRKTEGVIDTFTIPSILKACSQLSWIQQGKEIHGFVLKSGLDWDVFVQNALIQMYTECASMGSARKVFNGMPQRDIVSWSTMIRSYSRNRSHGEALELIREMHLSQVKPSEIAMINMVNLFADIANAKMGGPMHAYVIKNSDMRAIGVPIITALIDMYAKCGNITLARRLFNRLNQKSVVSWTAMIAGYIRCNKLVEAIQLFVKMQEENIFPNEISMLSLVLECGFTGALELGKQLHNYILRKGFKMSLQLSTALVDMYGKCGEMKVARSLFDSTNEKDVMMWTAMISGYAQAKRLYQVFDFFVQMRNAGVKPNEVTMVNLLSLCAEAGALDLGKWIHAYIDKEGIMADLILTTTLVDMYAKCGDIGQARHIFNNAPDRDICLWNAMLCGLAMHGYGVEALELFYKLENTEIKPNDITFIGVLHACSHVRLVTEGKKVFRQMECEFGVVPQVEHYGCMVDLLGRAGLLDEAYKFILRMPIQPNTIVWGSLLAACKLHKNLILGELAARRLLEMEPDNCGYNVLMSNIYAAAKRWNDVAVARKTMRDAGLRKAPGISAIEVNGSMHEFIMGDRSHPRTDDIYEMLTEMTKKLKQAGYVADTSAVLLNVDEEEKETALTYHSEKLAIAFGLISTSPSTPIRIVKNLRVCDDCHTATKILSKVFGRVIVVRDRNRFHHFNEGFCSCGDFW
ncbi:Pentatricopeptide repeat-containing protein [Thalictrum thalictroides]|uniref:Pentatricopeptide repeat-containing protein n=1 Tax=Thalictrum thalictroides TaxID=46969 RepID=A0A7J6WFW0_THATH|nr:Pentatricopeptide repeat-containing protein [Thalictrum thalictroides]